MSTEAGVVEAVEAKVKEVVTEVKNEAEKVVEDVVAVVKKTRVEITTEEQLFLRNQELEFVKFQVQIKDLNAAAKTKSDMYSAKIEELVKKYAIDKTEMLFDSIENVFKKKQ